jgi:dihydroflavonol-4-reductase
MTTLVTGATGFVGSAVVRQLLERGDVVRVLARAGGDRRNIAGLPVEVAEGDLRDPAAARRALAGISDLFHVAADYRLWVRDSAAMYATNVEATVSLMRSAADAGVSRIVYTSSVATLGVCADHTPADETTPASLDDMVGPYKRSKFLAEEAVRELAEREGLPIVIVNPAAPVGPRDIRPTPTGRIIIEAARGRTPAFVDTGLSVVHVDDVARGHLLAHERGQAGQRYILGGDNLTLQNILTAVTRLAGRRPPWIKLPAAAVLPVGYVSEALAAVFPRWEPFVTVTSVRLSKKRMYFSSDKARRDLGYVPRNAQEAFGDALTWFRANGYL